jgi:hypothetical protein
MAFVYPQGEDFMATNAFVGELKQPTDTQLAVTLGPGKKLWDRLVAELVRELNLDGQEWTSYSAKAGWSLRLKRKKRNILYLAPLHKSFRVALVLGDKAVAAALKSGLPKPILKLIAEAKRYPEGTAIRMQITRQQDLKIVKALAAIKLQN